MLGCHHPSTRDTSNRAETNLPRTWLSEDTVGAGPGGGTPTAALLALSAVSGALWLRRTAAISCPGAPSGKPPAGGFWRGAQLYDVPPAALGRLGAAAVASAARRQPGTYSNSTPTTFVAVKTIIGTRSNKSDGTNQNSNSLNRVQPAVEGWICAAAAIALARIHSGQRTRRACIPQPALLSGRPSRPAPGPLLPTASHLPTHSHSPTMLMYNQLIGLGTCLRTRCMLIDGGRLQTRLASCPTWLSLCMAM